MKFSSTRIFFWLIISLFTYQNCGDEAALNSSNELNENQSRPSTSLGVIDDSRHIKFKMEGLDGVIEMKKGQFIDSENPTWLNHCLQKGKLNLLTSLLIGNSVCEIENLVPQDYVCAEIYTFPYMEVFIGANTVRTKVGEAVNACPETSLELCHSNDSTEAFFRSLDFPTDFEYCPHLK